MALAKITESEWLTATRPTAMLMHVCGIRKVHRNESGLRKLRSFAAETCRRAVARVDDPLYRGVVTAMEAVVVGGADPAAVRSGYRRIRQSYQGDGMFTMSFTDAVTSADLKEFGRPNPQERLMAALHGLVQTLLYNPNARFHWVTGHEDAAVAARFDNVEAEFAHQADLVRDLFGNPFRPVKFDPRWRTSDAVALADAMYRSRDFGPMPVLADALEEAGCTNADVLAHCRGDGPHVRGCWVVDLVLGKS